MFFREFVFDVASVIYVIYKLSTDAWPYHSSVDIVYCAMRLHGVVVVVGSRAIS